MTLTTGARDSGLREFVDFFLTETPQLGVEHGKQNEREKDVDHFPSIDASMQEMSQWHIPEESQLASGKPKQGAAALHRRKGTKSAPPISSVGSKAAVLSNSNGSVHKEPSFHRRTVGDWEASLGRDLVRFAKPACRVGRTSPFVSTQSHTDRVVEQLDRVRTGATPPVDPAFLAEKKRERTRKSRRARENERALTREKKEELINTRMEEGEKRSCMAKLRRSYLKQEKQCTIYRSIYKNEIKVAEELSRVLREKELLRMRFWLAAICLSESMDPLGLAIQSKRAFASPLILMASKEQRAKHLILRMIRPKLRAIRRRRAARAWHTFHLHMNLIRLWVPVRKKRDAAHVIRRSLQRTKRIGDTRGVIHYYIDTIKRIQRRWRASRNRHKVFTNRALKVWKAVEHSLVISESRRKERVHMKLDAQLRNMGAARGNHRVALDRVTEFDLLPPSARKHKRRVARVAAMPVLAATEEERMLYNHEAERVPTIIRTLMIEKHYKNERDLEKHRFLASLSAPAVRRGSTVTQVSTASEGAQQPVQDPMDPEAIKSLILQAREEVVGVLRQFRLHTLEDTTCMTEFIRTTMRFKSRLLSNQLTPGEMHTYSSNRGMWVYAASAGLELSPPEVSIRAGQSTTSLEPDTGTSGNRSRRVSMFDLVECLKATTPQHVTTPDPNGDHTPSIMIQKLLPT